MSLRQAYKHATSDSWEAIVTTRASCFFYTDVQIKIVQIIQIEGGV